MGGGGTIDFFDSSRRTIFNNSRLQAIPLWMIGAVVVKSCFSAKRANKQDHPLRSCSTPPRKLRLTTKKWDPARAIERDFDAAVETDRSDVQGFCECITKDEDM